MHEGAEELAAVLAALGIARPILLGHSDGATIALLHAAHRMAPPALGVLAMAPHVFLEREGIVYDNGYQTHGLTETCPGHSTLLTGKTPAHTGIVGNSWYDPDAGKNVYCLAAPEYTDARGDPKALKVGPTNLVTGTLGDWLKQVSPASRVVAVAGKDRAAITLGGHRADAAFWYIDNFGFTTYVAKGEDAAAKLAPVAARTIYRGLKWSMEIDAKDVDSPPQKLRYEFGGAVPAGCVIDAETGEIAWTPGDEQPVGPVSLMVTVTDDGTPPASASVTITLNLMEDAARQTVVIAIGSVNDEGLPRTGKLVAAWKQLNGPGQVTFENATAARTHATFSAPGSYELELTATDGELSNATRIVVTVK